MNRRSFLTSVLALGTLAALNARTAAASDKGAIGRVVKSDEEWRRQLTPEQYEVTRRKGTEAPGSSPLTDEHRRGTCARRKTGVCPRFAPRCSARVATRTSATSSTTGRSRRGCATA